MTAPPPPGIYVPVTTFFVSSTASNYNPQTPPLDLEAQAAHAILLAKAGIKGLVLLGSTGESVHLTRSERTQQIRFVRKALDAEGFKKYPLLAGTATNSIDETVELLTEAKEAGADWGLVLAPGYFGGVATEEGIVGWYRAVADRSPIGVLIYHYPGVSNNVKLPPSTFRTLASHPNIVGAKISHGDVSVHSQIALDPSIDHSAFHVFTGLGQVLFPALQVGAVGAIDGLSGFFPKTMVRLYTLSQTSPLDKDTLAKVRELQYSVSAAEELVVRWGTTGIREAVARVLGIGEVTGGRFPLGGGMGKGEWEKWDGVIGRMVELEKQS
ncbi:hypothetical protein RUND412_003025 [Rhizina undulata]